MMSDTNWVGNKRHHTVDMRIRWARFDMGYQEGLCILVNGKETCTRYPYEKGKMFARRIRRGIQILRQLYREGVFGDE